MRPIKITEGMKTSIIEEFTNFVNSSSMANGTLKFEKSFKFKNESKKRASIVIEPIAALKIIMLVQHFNDEVAWHCIVDRDSEDDSRFFVRDVLVYPQVVTGSTVDTDQEEYQKWMMELDDEVFERMKMQCHSHVNMAVFSSATDSKDQSNIVKMLKDEDFYIFIIANKKFQREALIYDLKNNVMYDNDDIDVEILGVDLTEFLADADKKVNKSVVTYTTTAKKGSSKSEKNSASSKDEYDDDVGVCYPYSGARKYTSYYYNGNYYDYEK